MDRDKLPKRTPQAWNTGQEIFATWRLHPDQPPLSPEERTAIQSNLTFFHRQRYHLAASVVMDDHIHVIILPEPEFALPWLIRAWKSYTADRLRQEFGRTDTVWQPKYFSRPINSQEQLERAIAYIGENPHRCWPETGPYEWARLYPPYDRLCPSSVLTLFAPENSHHVCPRPDGDRK